MKIKDNNYDEEYIINSIMRDLNQIKEDVTEYKNIHNSTIKSAEMLYRNLMFFKENVLEEE